jgi:phospholipid/cholesterol/gamma-HCH transport system ATP-binding protein
VGDILRKIHEAGENVSELLGHTHPPHVEEAPRPVDEPVVSFKDVHASFDRPVLKGVSFDLYPGETKIILGGSGSGKTTILRLILGLLKPDKGSILVRGAHVAQLSEDELRAVRLKIGMVFQEGALFDSLSVGANVGYQLQEERKLSEAEVEKRVGDMLGYVELDPLSERMPSELSGGQRRRVAVARALAARPEIMLYDEPTTGLDPITATTITQLIVKARDLGGVTSILVTHQLRDAFNVARSFLFRTGGEKFVYNVVEDVETLAGTQFLMLREGEVQFEGSADELRKSKDPYIREFLS